VRDRSLNRLVLAVPCAPCQLCFAVIRAVPSPAAQGLLGVGLCQADERARALLVARSCPRCLRRWCSQRATTVTAARTLAPR
jgi:hypothetical protein